MKKKLIIVLTVLIVGAASIVVAQKMIVMGKSSKFYPEKRAEQQTQKMTDIYQLNEDQQKKIYDINLDFQKQLFEITKDKNTTVDLKSKEDQLRNEHELNILPILNADQKSKWNENKAHRTSHPKETKK